MGSSGFGEGGGQADLLRDEEATRQAAGVADFWDSEYVGGRLRALPPDGFVGDILAAADACGLLPGPGLYIGAGNGRNYFPLVAGGLDLVGLDVSAVGIDAIRTRAPERADRLVVGTLDALPPGETHPVVIGLNVFHHGTRDFARAHIRSAMARVAPGGLFCVHTSVAGSRAGRPHEVAEEHEDGSVTLRYLTEDPNTPGLYAHFFSEAELAALLADFEPVVPLVADDIDPATGKPADWLRRQGVFRRPTGP